MKYIQPYGISDPNAPYINGDPSIARMGSIPPAEAFEHPMRELVEVISASVFVPTSSDLTQVAQSVRSQRMNYCEDTGSANVLSVALNPPLINYTIGLPLHVKIRNTNTGPSTIDAGAGRVPVRRPDGSEMASGDLDAGAVIAMIYDGTVFQVINFFGTGGTGTINNFVLSIPYCVDSSPTANTVTANFSPAITAPQLAAGFICMVKIANTNTTFSNINVNGLGLKPINAQGGTTSYPLLPGDLQAGDVIVLIYDGTRFWVYANPAINQAITFNVSSISQINDLFAALGRKRISNIGSVLIQLASGIYTGLLTTYHPDAGHITIQGTMIGAVPQQTDFARTGSDPASRANDSAYNILMLRAKYGTEFRFGNTIGGRHIIQHQGPGPIYWKNVLITGANTLASFAELAAIGPDRGSAMICENVTVWGSGAAAWGPNSSFLHLINCYACGCWQSALNCGQNQTVFLKNGGGCYGNAGDGIYCGNMGMVFNESWTSHPVLPPSPPFQVMYNGGNGCSAQWGFIYMQLGVIAGNELFDLLAQDMGLVVVFGVTANTASPAPDTVGNNNALVRNLGP